MKIDKAQTPWHKPHSRRSRPQFYGTPEWRKLRSAFIQGSTTLPDGRQVSNAICRNCYLQGRTEPMHTVDHIQRIRDGGDSLNWNNLQSLCRRCHDRKTSNEGHEAKKRMLSTNIPK